MSSAEGERVAFEGDPLPHTGTHAEVWLRQLEAAMRFYPWEILGEPNGTGAREPISRALSVADTVGRWFSATAATMPIISTAQIPS